MQERDRLAAEEAAAKAAAAAAEAAKKSKSKARPLTPVMVRHPTGVCAPGWLLRQWHVRRLLSD